MALIVLYDLFCRQHEPIARVVDTLSTRPVDILFLGDSSVRACGSRDAKPDSITRLLAQMGPCDVLPADSAAYSPIVYQDWVEIVARQPHKPKVIVIPINLRSFSEAWFTRPGYQFELDRIRARLRYLGFTAGGVKDYLDARFTGRVERAKEAWRNSEVVYGDMHLGKRTRIDELALINCTEPLEYLEHHDFGPQLAMQFKYHYMNIITPSHGMLGCLGRTIARAAASRAAVVCYITPINHEDATRYVGPGFAERVRANVAVVMQYLATTPAHSEDLSFALSSDHFVDKRTSSEHLDLPGREFVARRIHEVIERGGLLK